MNTQQCPATGVTSAASDTVSLTGQNNCPVNLSMIVRDVTGNNRLTIESVRCTQTDNSLTELTLNVRIVKNETNATEPSLSNQLKSFFEKNRPELKKHANEIKTIPALLANLKRIAECQMKNYESFDPNTYEGRRSVMETSMAYHYKYLVDIEKLETYSILKDLLMLEELNLTTGNGEFNLDHARKATAATLEKLSFRINAIDVLNELIANSE